MRTPGSNLVTKPQLASCHPAEDQQGEDGKLTLRRHPSPPRSPPLRGSASRVVDSLRIEVHMSLYAVRTWI